MDLKHTEEEKSKVFNSLKRGIEPKSLENLLNWVKDVDDQLILSFGLLLSYGGKNDELDFLNAIWE
ncbi:hypothetical protein [Carnobacterium divergens]|uniref:hypothetical protein n=1 Tax=Carnobacterium divergens TaxID=2748 RepID=UPI0039B0F71B